MTQSPPSFTTSCVNLELGPLSSAGITRLHRSYEPVRHPKRPGQILADLRLGTAPTTEDFPCCVDLSIHTCCRHYPGGNSRLHLSLASPTVSAFLCFLPESASASPFSGFAQRSLLVAARVFARPPKGGPLHRRLRPLRYLHDRSDCYRPERQLPGGSISHRETAPFHGAQKSGLAGKGRMLNTAGPHRVRNCWASRHSPIPRTRPPVCSGRALKAPVAADVPPAEWKQRCTPSAEPRRSRWSRWAGRDSGHRACRPARR